MPATDILNPTAVWSEDIQDSMTPNYGFTRKRTATKLNKKAIGGTPWTRETQNTGHVFNFSWLTRSWACVQRLKWYYEQYEDGFFTIIDWDGGGRHYVGRFTSEVIPVETGNGMWDVQNVTFEEIPQQQMVEFPSDWANDAVGFFVANDYGDQKLATSGSWTQTTHRGVAGAQSPGHFSLIPWGSPAGGALNASTTYVTMDNPGTTAGDWACYEYRGYGFRLYMLKGPEFGMIDIYLDGVLLETVNCFNAVDIGPQIVYANANIPLDIHRVQVQPSSQTPGVYQISTLHDVVNAAPVLTSISGALTVAGANDILGGSLLFTCSSGAPVTVNLGAFESTDTIGYLAAAINRHISTGGRAPLLPAYLHSVTATVTGNSLTFTSTDPSVTIAGSALTDTTPGIYGELALPAAHAASLAGTMTVTDVSGDVHEVPLGTPGTTDSLLNLQYYFNVTNASWGIVATLITSDDNGTGVLTFAVAESPAGWTANPDVVLPSSTTTTATTISWYALEVMR